MKYISQVTADIGCIKEVKNPVADALSRMNVDALSSLRSITLEETSKDENDDKDFFIERIEFHLPEIQIITYTFL